MTREPVAVVNGVTALVEATISFAVAFGLKWGPEQVGATMAVVVAVGNLTKTWWARSQTSLRHCIDGFPAIARAYVSSRSHVRSVRSRA